ncbi:MAG: Na+ dependent nucleoside transporter N-terminal domain-containing protein, partial [Planctomycetota bacterium]
MFLTHGLVAGLAAGGFSSLNFVSLLGLGLLVLLAWLMGSARSQVNWRLVLTGILMQFAIAAVLFNSQTWTFPSARNELRSLTDLEALVTQYPEQARAVDAYISDVTAKSDRPASSLAAWREAVGSAGESADAANRLISERPPVLPRFP